MEKRKARSIGIGILILLFVFFVFSGCGLFGPEERVKPIDPPRNVSHDHDEDDFDITYDPLQIVDGKMIGEVLYLLDPNGYVVPTTIQIPYSEAIAKQVLTYMVKDGPVENLLPLGFEALLPEGTTFTIDIKEGLAVVDFSKEFTNYEVKDERKIVEGITWALTEFPTVDRVQLQVMGTPLTVMPHGKTPVDKPLTREMGINLEMAEEAQPGQTSAVTIYFEGETPTGDFQYFVPITRLVPRTNDLSTAALKELIKGPILGSGLVYSLQSSMQVLRTTVDNGIAIADFDDVLLGFDEFGGASTRGLQSVVLSLAATTGASKVQIMVNGNTELVTDTMDFSQPVSVPKQINPISY